MRIAFIDFVEGCFDLFSKKFFLQQELFKVLDYATDEVINVRIRLAKVFCVVINYLLRSWCHCKEKLTLRTKN